MADGPRIPFTELLKTVPGVFGIRLEEEPKHELVEKVGDIEIRRYAPATLAEVTVPGEHERAVDEAFDRLAKYIFGENHPRGREAMARGAAEGERMSMTNPVFQAEDGQGWVMSFFLSNETLPEDAPAPKDPGIRLRREPEHLVAVLRYSGNNSEQKMQEARAALLAQLREQGRYQPEESVRWAQYDAPFVIPFLKRNEALVAVSPRA